MQCSVIHSPVKVKKFNFCFLFLSSNVFPVYMSRRVSLKGLPVWTCPCTSHVIDTYFARWISYLFILPLKAFKAKGNMHFAMFLVIYSPVRDRKKKHFSCVFSLYLWMFSLSVCSKGTTHKTTCLNELCTSHYWHISVCWISNIVYLAANYV